MGGLGDAARHSIHEVQLLRDPGAAHLQSLRNISLQIDFATYSTELCHSIFMIKGVLHHQNIIFWLWQHNRGGQIALLFALRLFEIQNLFV